MNNQPINGGGPLISLRDQQRPGNLNQLGSKIHHIYLLYPIFSLTMAEEAHETPAQAAAALQDEIAATVQGNDLNLPDQLEDHRDVIVNTIMPNIDAAVFHDQIPDGIVEVQLTFSVFEDQQHAHRIWRMTLRWGKLLS